MIEKILERLEELKSDWNCDWNNPINEAIKIVQEVAKDGGWIPCSERLPKKDERILCFHSGGLIDCGDFICNTFCCDMDEYLVEKDEIIAWQLLPAPYRKGE